MNILVFLTENRGYMIISVYNEVDFNLKYSNTLPFITLHIKFWSNYFLVSKKLDISILLMPRSKLFKCSLPHVLLIVWELIRIIRHPNIWLESQEF